MESGMSLLFPILRIAAALSVVVAVFIAFKLYRETDRGWYWACLVLSALFFALSQWMFIFFPLVPRFGPGMRPGPGGFEGISVLRDASEIAASVLFAVACYGMYKTMHKIRKRVE